MTSETPNLHVLKNLNISKTKQDIEEMKRPLRLVWKCCSDAFKIGSTIFRRRGTLNVAAFLQLIKHLLLNPIYWTFSNECACSHHFAFQLLCSAKIVKSNLLRIFYYYKFIVIVFSI